MARASGFGGGFAQGLSQVLTQGLPLAIQQRLAEAKIAQEEEELKVRKKLVDAQAAALEQQAAKSLREAMTAAQLGHTFEALGGTAPVPGQEAGIEAGVAPVEGPTMKGRLARQLAEGGHAKEALGLFPELTQQPDNLKEALTHLGITAPPGGPSESAPAAASGMPLEISGSDRDPNAFSLNLNRQGQVQIGKRKVSVNISAEGKRSLQVTWEPTAYEYKTNMMQLPDGRKQQTAGVWDPQSGWIIPPQPLGSPAYPEEIQRFGFALSSGYGFQPNTPVFEAALGEMLKLHGIPDQTVKQQRLKELDARLRRTADHLRPAAGSSLPAGQEGSRPELGMGSIAETERRAREVEGAKTESLAAASERGKRRERALEGADRQKHDALVSAERQGAQIAALFRPEFVGKGFSAGFTRAWNEQEGAARKGRYVSGGVFGALREWIGSASPEEVQFRRAVADISDMILRARSGAQINEQEYTRLKQMLFKLTDEPTTFLPALQRFRQEIGAQIDDLLESGTESAASLRQKRGAGTLGGSPAKLTTFPEPMVVEDPAGKRYELAPGEKLPQGWRPLRPYRKGDR